MSDTTPTEPESSSEPTPFTAASEPTPFTESTAGTSLTGAAEIEPAAPLAPTDGTVPPASATEPARGPKQTLAGRVWIAIACAALLLVLLIIFIAENTRSVTINFLGAHGHLSLGLALLVAVVIGIIITLLVGSARIVQLTLEVRRHRRRLRDLV